MHKNEFNVKQSHKTMETLFHPKYKHTYQYDYYDMAIVTIDRPVTFTSKIRPICLPKLSDNFEGKKATVAGW